MKKTTILAVFLLVVVLVVPAYAAKPIPVADEVVVVNTDPIPVQGSVDVMNTVSVTGDVAVTNTPDVNIVNEPIAVTMTDPCQVTMVSEFVVFSVSGNSVDYSILTVPGDKMFVVTDIVERAKALGTDPFDLTFSLIENSTLKYREQDQRFNMRFNSGIVFAAESAVIMNVQSPYNIGGTVLISGYLISN